ncbi:MAG: Gfo/Idh/MocA family oxidoreductase [Actinobacteria bacterium]|nr:Gfo/Idh/MocA family oxidoreductase [Actinomycetota bacterium]
MSARPARLRVAMAGVHRSLSRSPAGHNWAAAFAAVPETEMVAVFDRGAETRAMFRDVWGELPAYDEYPRMLEEVRPDIVCIATRQTLHTEQCEQAVEAGVRGIVFDKPLATSMQEADRIVAACERRRVPVAFGLDRRWLASVRDLVRQLRQGLIGKVEVVIGYNCPNLINHGCHWFDTLLNLAGDPLPVWASGEVLDVSSDPPGSRRPLDPPGRCLFGLDNGVLGYVLPEGGPQMGFELLGDGGRLLVLNDFRAAVRWEVEGGPASGASSLRETKLKLPLEWQEGHPAGAAAVRDLVQAIATGGTTACDVQQARTVSEMGFAIYASHKAGGARVPLPLADRSHRVASFRWGNE